MISDDKCIEHESFGMVGLSRFSGGEQVYFGSSIKHSGGITLRIKKAKVERHLNRDWYFGTDLICEVDLSASQFTELITNMNVGDGVPCTIKYAEHKKMGEPPFENKRLQFEDEFRRECESVASQLKDITEKAKELLNGKKPLNANEKREILDSLYKCNMFLNSNMPFMAAQFNEQMDLTVKEAKGEVDCFVTQAITKLGMEKLEDLKQLASGKTKEELK